MLLFQVLVNGNINTYLIKGLSPITEYEVLLAAIYSNEVESDEMILVESTSKLNVSTAGTSERLLVFQLSSCLQQLLKFQVWRFGCFANCYHRANP